ncbi:MAG: 30S ribosomal protein S5 [Candidatus Heimdallarchaeota archaeon]|nr:30S ribosomal protein S5 [Candidatus Heimdallarchaeota archaeon]
MSRRRERTQPSLDLETWIPRTSVGQLVKDGTIASIYDIFRDSLKIDDVEVVDFLVPNLTETVLNVARVQRQTDAGRKTLFVATAGVGNKNGIVGVAQAKAAGVGTAIRNAIVSAKLNIVPVKRGCGSWECTCSNPHSIPFEVHGKVGSVKILLKPAPKGLGLVVGDVAKSVLELAGISDIWSNSFGDTRTTQNFCKAAFEALKATYQISHVSEWGE